MGEVKEACKQLIEEACERNGLILLAIETDIAHVHLFVWITPALSSLPLSPIS